MSIVLSVGLALAAAPLQAGVVQTVISQPKDLPSATFSLPELPYDASALEPVIDAETMRIHHGRHHQAYVTNLNGAVVADPAMAAMTLEQMMATVSTLPKAIRDNGGGHWNHTFFWQSMAPPSQAGAPSVDLMEAIEESFGSVDDFKAQFTRAGAARFGSGWVWLIVDGSGRLAITSTPNQDNPLMDIAETRGTPILGNDVWEHAYYLKYQNRRGDYLTNWWQLVNWAQVSHRYAEAQRRSKRHARAERM